MPFRARLCQPGAGIARDEHFRRRGGGKGGPRRAGTCFFIIIIIFICFLMRLWMRLTVCVFGIRWVRLNLVFFDTCGCAFRCDPCGMCVNSCRDFHKLIPVLCHLTFARHLSPAQVGDLKARIVELEGQLAKLSAANQKRDGHEVHTGGGLLSSTWLGGAACRWRLQRRSRHRGPNTGHLWSMLLCLTHRRTLLARCVFAGGAGERTRGKERRSGGGVGFLARGAKRAPCHGGDHRRRPR